MVFAIEFNGAFRNDNRRDAVASAVTTRLADFTRFGIDDVQVVTKVDHGLHILVRFVSEVDRDTFWTDMLTEFGSGIQGPVVDSFAQKHDCNHDVPSHEFTSECLVTETVTF